MAFNVYSFVRVPPREPFCHDPATVGVAITVALGPPAAAAKNVDHASAPLTAWQPPCKRADQYPKWPVHSLRAGRQQALCREATRGLWGSMGVVQGLDS